MLGRIDRLRSIGAAFAKAKEGTSAILLALVLPTLAGITLARHVLSPADLPALNINLVGGDPYGGDCSLDQSFLWRQMPALRNHATPVAGLWHIGASTHPGPGLGGGSGVHLAQALGAL